MNDLGGWELSSLSPRIYPTQTIIVLLSSSMPEKEVLDLVLACQSQVCIPAEAWYQV